MSELIQSQIIKVIKPSDLGYFVGYKTYLSTSSIIENKIVSNEGLVSFDKRPSRASLKPINNSVWFAKMKNSIKVFLADSYAEQNYIMSTGYYGFLSSDKILSRWLKFTFMSDYFNDQKNRFSEGSSMSAIKESQLNDIHVPIITNESSLQTSVLLLSKIEKVIGVSDEKLNNLVMLKETLLFKLFV